MHLLHNLLVLMTMWLSWHQSAHAQNQENCIRAMELIYVVDGSNSVNIKNFGLIKNGLMESVNALDIGTETVRVGVVTFGSSLASEIPLSADKAQILQAINRTEWPDGSTAAHLALWWAIDQMITSSRPNVPRVVVMLSDGESNSRNETLAASQAANDVEIQMYAVGVGNLVNLDELRNITAPHTNRVYFLQDFNVLTRQLRNITLQVCAQEETTTTTRETVTPTMTTTTPVPPVNINPECAKVLDLVLIVDGSSDMAVTDFITLKEAVRQAALYFVISQTTARVGVVTAQKNVPLSSDRNFVDSGIQSMQSQHFYAGPRQVWMALRSAEMMFSRGTSVPKVLITIATGDSDVPAWTVAAAQTLREAGVHLYVLGVTSAVSNAELNYLTGNQTQQQYRASSYQLLQFQLRQLIESICRTDFPSWSSTTSNPTPLTPKTTATTAPTPPYSTSGPWPEKDHCKTGRIVNGVGFSFDPEDCSSFIQCYFREDSTSIAVRRKCPMGQFWDQGQLRCDEACNVDCPEDPCRKLPESMSRPMNESCRAYWLCLGGRSRPRCCAPGQRFAIGSGCLSDYMCNDKCGPHKCQHAVEAVCDKKPHWADSGRYDLLTPTAGWTSMQCTSGVFDLLHCSCQ